MRSVPAPEVAVGKDARVALAEHRAALGQANTRLVNSRTWYECVRTSYGDQVRECAKLAP